MKVLLRRPRAPPPLPRPSTIDVITYSKDQLSVPDNTPRYSAKPATRIERILKSAVSEEIKQKHLFAEVMFGTKNRDLRYYLTRAAGTRAQTSATDGRGEALPRARKPRGPDALPPREPIRACLQMHNLMQIFDNDDERFIEPPRFTLNDFLINMSEIVDAPLYQVSKAVLSRNTYKHIIEQVREELSTHSLGRASSERDLNELRFGGRTEQGQQRLQREQRK